MLSMTATERHTAFHLKTFGFSIEFLFSYCSK